MYKVTPIDEGKELNIEINGTFEEVMTDFLKSVIGTIELLSEQTEFSKDTLNEWLCNELKNFYSSKEVEEEGNRKEEE